MPLQILRQSVLENAGTRPATHAQAEILERLGKLWWYGKIESFVMFTLWFGFWSSHIITSALSIQIMSVRCNEQSVFARGGNAHLLSSRLYPLTDIYYPTEELEIQGDQKYIGKLATFAH